MDELALRVLAAEISADLQVIQETASLAKERFGRPSRAVSSRNASRLTGTARVSACFPPRLRFDSGFWSPYPLAGRSKSGSDYVAGCDSTIPVGRD
jgi:hypothetical protein